MYVIASNWNTLTVYFESLESNTKHLTEDIKKAAYFKTKAAANKTLIQLNDDLFKVYEICPNCGNVISFYPAISRRDNKTHICSDCGVLEALAIYELNK